MKINALLVLNDPMISHNYQIKNPKWMIMR